MAAEIIEEVAPEETDELPTSEEMSTEELVQDLAPADTTEDPVEELPDKYKGKSIQDIVGMHQEAEKLIGKHSGEVGELRSYVDGFIKAKLTESDSQPPTPEEEVDFFEDPAKAVSKAIDTHPAVQAATQQAQQYKQQTAMGQLQQKHPDMKEVLGNPKFQEWVKGSKIRLELFQRADQAYDFDCADELISQYKERSNVVQQAAQVETQARATQVKAASTGSASGSGNAGAKRVYRRADIIKLMKNDPERYEALSGEIMEAYRTGRVR